MSTEFEGVFTLTKGDRQSPVWMKLMRHFNTQVDILHSKNDGPNDAALTATLRGQIAAYKALIALDKDLPIID